MTSPAPRLLVVDDHPDTLLMLNRLLTRSGFEVHTALSAGEAVVLAQSNSFDLALVDVGLPDRDGCDLMRELRDVYGLKGIALTGYGMQEDVERCRAAGFSSHVLKPFDMRELIGIVTAVVGGRDVTPSQ